MTTRKKLGILLDVSKPSFPGCPPATPEEWAALRGMSESALREIGLRTWDSRPDGRALMLIPGEWYRAIPAGFRVVDINDFDHNPITDEAFVPGGSDNDIWFGCLTYGIVVQGAEPADE